MLCTYCTVANNFFSQKLKHKNHLLLSPLSMKNSPCFHRLFTKEPELPTKTADQRLEQRMSGMTRNERNDKDDWQE